VQWQEDTYPIFQENPNVAKMEILWENSAWQDFVFVSTNLGNKLARKKTKLKNWNVTIFAVMTRLMVGA
jgi:hypothetical protein